MIATLSCGLPQTYQEVNKDDNVGTSAYSGYQLVVIPVMDLICDLPPRHFMADYVLVFSIAITLVFPWIYYPILLPVLESHLSLKNQMGMVFWIVLHWYTICSPPSNSL